MRTRTPVLFWLAGLGLCAAAIACFDQTPLGITAGSGGNNTGNSLIVYGTTTSGASGAVAANLTVTAEDSACSGTTYGSATGTSSSAGVYRITVTATSAAAGCVVVTGTVAGNSNPVTLTQAGVSFGTGDSVQVNLSFP